MLSEILGFETYDWLLLMIVWDTHFNWDTYTVHTVVNQHL